MIYEYKFIGLEFQTELQEAIIAVSSGIDTLTSEMWKAIYTTVEKTANEHGKKGWRLRGWAMEPAPHLMLERTVNRRKTSDKSK